MIYRIPLWMDELPIIELHSFRANDDNLAVINHQHEIAGRALAQLLYKKAAGMFFTGLYQRMKELHEGGK